MKYLIFWGVGGGYGGIANAALVDYPNSNLSEEDAYERAREACESYGIGDGCEDNEEWQEEIEKWAVYQIIENPTKEQIEKAKQYHFEDETKE